MPADADLDLGQTLRGFRSGENLFGRYTLKAILGRGGMGIVWRAFDEHLQRDVALKFLPELIVLDHAALDDLKRETKRNLDLTHHNIVRIYDFANEGDTACISMEYVDGSTLSALRVQREAKAFEVEELGPIVSQVCQALEYAHSKALIVHRDLKPANLMLNKDGHLKITDFGIARSLSDSVSMLSMRASSGTLLYMSPQQLDGERPSTLDDIYSLGATLYELLTSKPPFFSGSIDSQIREKKPLAIAARRNELGITSDYRIPEIWETTIAECLAKDPKLRPSNAREIAERLGLIAPEAGTQAVGTARRIALGYQIRSKIPVLRGAGPWRSNSPTVRIPISSRKRRRIAVSVTVATLLVLGVVLATKSSTFQSWSAEIFERKPTNEWVRAVSIEKMTASFGKGELLQFDPREITVRSEAAGHADIAIDGIATTRGALYEAVTLDDAAVDLTHKLAELRTARERARFLSDRASIEIASVDENQFQFVKETTALGKSVPFHFQFKARRKGTDWQMDKVIVADLVPPNSLSGQPITAFRQPSILGTDKANHAKAEIAQLIDGYASEVRKNEALAVKRLAAKGLDSKGDFLFPPNRAMPGERFPQTRMGALQTNELQAWPDENLQYAINEVFARHGASFGDKKLSASFAHFSWYRARPNLTNEQIEESFSDIEAENLRILSSARAAKQEIAAAQREQERQAAIQAQQEMTYRAQQEAAIRAQQEAARAQQEAAIQAQKEEAARQAIGGLLQGIINAIPRK